MNLYVDVDDTLILWSESKSGGGIYAGGHTPNAKLIEALIRWRILHLTSDHIFIWSGGGADYAQGWAEKYLGWKLWFAALDKHEQLHSGFYIPQVGDICIDDQSLETAAIVMSPKKFIEFMA